MEKYYSLNELSELSVQQLIELDDGDPDVAREIGRRMRDGEGFTPDKKTADRFFAYADRRSEVGGKVAHNAVDPARMYADMDDDALYQAAFAQGGAALSLAIDRAVETNDRLRHAGDLTEHALAMPYCGGRTALALARCYEKGIGVGRDHHKALMWYKNAADCEDSYAALNELREIYSSKKRLPEIKTDSVKAAICDVRYAFAADYNSKAITARRILNNEPGYEAVIPECDRLIKEAILEFSTTYDVQLTELSDEETIDILREFCLNNPEAGCNLLAALILRSGFDISDDSELMRLFSSHGIRDYDYDIACMLIREDEEGNRDEILRLMRGVTGNNRQNALTYRAKRAYREHDYDEFRSAYNQISAPSKELTTKNEYVLSNSPDALLAKADRLFSKKEYDGAENCYRKAAELNCAEGYIGIARIYLTAQKRDLHKAIEAYRSAETMGSSEAAAELRSDKLRMQAKWFLDAYNGDVKAQRMLADGYREGRLGLERNREYAIEYYLMAANTPIEHASDAVRTAVGAAACDVAMMFMNRYLEAPKVNTADFERCQMYLRKARVIRPTDVKLICGSPKYRACVEINSGNQKAIKNTAKDFFKNNDNEYKTASFYLGKWLSDNSAAAIKENTNSPGGLGCYICGTISEKGYPGMAKNMAQAWSFYQKGADMFLYKDCISRVKDPQMAHFGELLQADKYRAITAAQLDELGRMYDEYGGFVEYDPERSKAYYRRAERLRK